MAIHVRDAETDVLVRELAARTGLGITDSIKEAVECRLKQLDSEPSLYDKLKPLIDEINAKRRYPPPPETDKEFWDDMCGDL